MTLDPVTGIADLVKDGIDKIWPSKTQEEIDKTQIFIANLNAQLEARKLQLQIDLAAEQQPGWFTKGRDGALWTCALSFFWMFLARPMLQFAFIACGHPLNLPPLDVATTQDLLGGLLGLGGMHMYQQVKGS